MAVAQSSTLAVEIVRLERTSKPEKKAATRGVCESRKLDGAFCIARMVVTEKLQTGEVVVEYVSTHSGHKPSVEKVKNIPPTLRKDVQEKFAAGITIERIMDGEWII